MALEGSAVLVEREATGGSTTRHIGAALRIEIARPQTDLAARLGATHWLTGRPGRDSRSDVRAAIWQATTAAAELAIEAVREPAIEAAVPE